MANPRRVHAAPRSAVLYVYDPSQEVPQVEPAPDSLVVVVPSDASDITEQIERFFDALPPTLKQSRRTE